MASRGINFKSLPKVKKAYLFVTISFFLFVLGFGIKAAYAYYHESTSVSIFANLIGDFDLGDADINMMFYKEGDDGLYYRTYAIPQIGYEFDNTLTKCTIPCSMDNNDECFYSYNEDIKQFSLTSNQKVTCKFYFNEVSDKDITINLLKEDLAGTYTYNNKTYSLIESIPAYGYNYVDYECDESATVNFDPETKRFNVQTATKNKCYAYFDEYGNPDITVNVYVQSKPNSSVYNLVDTIPANNKYVLSTSKESKCVDMSRDLIPNAKLTYENGYIYINAEKQQKCDVYLDIAE